VTTIFADEAWNSLVRVVVVVVVVVVVAVLTRDLRVAVAEGRRKLL